jgi:putative ABC transport system ATP-binding protein
MSQFLGSRSALPVFELDHVDVSFGTRQVLREIDLTVERGITVLTGPSGSGKTTLLRLCNRLEVPTCGRVLFHGADVATLDPLALRRRVGMVFQRPTLFAGTMRDNLRVARQDSDDVYADVLNQVGLTPACLDEPCDTLSGGEAQRTCLARALLTGPEVLLMDEPTSSLDRSATRVLEDLTAQLVNDGLSVLWVSHDLAQVRRIADECVVLLDGRIALAEQASTYLEHREPLDDADEGGMT